MENTDKLYNEIIDAFCDDISNLSNEEKQKLFDKIDTYLAKDPTNTNILFYKSIYYSQINDYKKSNLILEKILEIDPNCSVSKEAQEILKINKDLEEYNSNVYEDNSFRFLQKVPCELILIIKLILVVTACVLVFFDEIFSQKDKNIFSSAHKYQRLEINELTELNFLSKADIYKLRKEYVNKSLFAAKDYEPNDAVFGQIVDNKPWWGTISCQNVHDDGNFDANIQGKSLQSKQINNPNVLVGIVTPYIPRDRENNSYCHSDYAKLLPNFLYYDKKNNLIEVRYQVKHDFLDMYIIRDSARKKFPLQLSGLNARDFGYNYVYAESFKNASIENKNENDITNRVSIFNDFIHLGESCKYNDGCNNVSPMQFDKTFVLSALPATIDLKLWKKQPANKYQKADIYYRIIIEDMEVR